MKKIILFTIVAFLSLQLSAQVYGPYYGASIFANKSNLFNSDDYRTDSFQKYQMTFSFAGSFDYGYLYQNGFSVQSGIQFGSCNQNYKGSDNAYSYDMKATAKTSFIKIPIIFGIQKNNDKKLKLLYSLGFFYSYNTGYSEKIDLTFKNPINNVTWNQTTTVKGTSYTIDNNYDSLSKGSYTMDKRPYQRHGLGSIAAIGIRYSLKQKVEFTAQIRSEFTFTNAEITETTRFTPVNKPGVFSTSGHVFDNYSKYMNDPKTNWNRASTHPFNIGLSLGLRYYIFNF